MLNDPDGVTALKLNCGAPFWRLADNGEIIEHTLHHEPSLLAIPPGHRFEAWSSVTLARTADH